MFGLGKKDITKCVVTFQHSSPTAADDFVGTFDIAFTGVGAAEYAAKWEDAKQAEIARAPEYIKQIRNNIDFIKTEIGWEQKIANEPVPKKKLFMSKREKEEEYKILSDACKAWTQIKQFQEIITRDQWALECLSRLGYETFSMASAADNFLSEEGFIRDKTKGDVGVTVKDKGAGMVAIHFIDERRKTDKIVQLGGLGYGVCHSLYGKKE